MKSDIVWAMSRRSTDGYSSERAWKVKMPGELSGNASVS
jgi:hypothetical protein